MNRILIGWALILLIMCPSFAADIESSRIGEVRASLQRDLRESEISSIIPQLENLEKKTLLEEKKTEEKKRVDAIDDKDYIDAIKSRIALSSEFFCDETECFNISNRVRNAFFTGLKDGIADRYEVSFAKFMEKKESNYVLPIAQKFFSEADQPEHLVFSFYVGSHVFLIEKKSNVINTWWRVYQSSAGEYSLGQWLGIKPWIDFTAIDFDKLSEREAKFRKKFGKYIDRMYHEYGQGKKLSKEQVTGFLQAVTDYQGGKIIVYMYTVDPAAYDAIPSRANMPIDTKEFRISSRVHEKAGITMAVV